MQIPVINSGFPGGLLLPETKSQSNVTAAPLVALPERLILPLQQHIGLPATPHIKIGDKVLKGQKIADSGGYVSVPLHSTSSGKVIDIGMYPVSRPWLHDAMCIVIEPDGEDKWCELQPVPDYNNISPEKLQEVIRNCGIVGLGGAGFPAHVKLKEGVENQVETLIINGAECEPFISCDDRLIREKASYVVAGTKMIARTVGAKHSIIALEQSMPEAAETLQQHLAKDGSDHIELVMVESRYPAGGEKQLIQTLTGRQVPSGGLGIHIGIVVHNVATAAAVFRAVSRGEPVVSRYLTVTGAIESPGNLQVLLGTPVKDCVKMCEQQDTKDKQIIVGGPMMGSSINNLMVPVTKTVNCILVQEQKPRKEPEPCIRCGECVAVCPVQLQPQLLHRAAIHDDIGKLREHHIFDCIECGCCSYVCPSSIPLVEQYRHAKGYIAEYERSRQGVDHARQRFIKREQRIQEQQQEKQNKLNQIDDTTRKQKMADILNDTPNTTDTNDTDNNKE